MPRKPHPLAPGPGRPSLVKATPELVDAACADIALGLPVESALILRGISPQGMAKWREKNPAVELAFKTAEATFERSMVVLMQAHAKRDAKAVQWLMERRTRGQWAAPAGKVELTGKDGGPMQSLTISKALLASVAGGPDQARPMLNVTPRA